jgi:cell division protein ZapA (FtsZ GTPase activity inhibitor)
MPAPERRVVKVRILDKQYAFASQGEEADEQIRRVAQLVDDQMRHVGSQARGATAMQTAVLTGLELADELHRLRREVDSVEDSITQRTNRLTESLGELFRRVEAVTSPADD